MVASLWDMAVSLLGSVAVAASSIVVPIPQSTNFFAQTSGTIVSQQFSTDPRTGAVAASQSQGANLEAFIYHDGQCPYVGEELYYRVYVGNSGDSPARNLVIQFQYPPGTSFVSADPGADTLDEPRRIVLWRLGTLAPLHGYAEYSVAVRATATGAKSSSLVVTYVDERGQTQVALTSHTIPDGCGEAGSDSKPRPAGKSPAIICDPAETSCTGFLPELGKRFGLAQPAVQDLALGVRFEEAVANILPGECGVVADDIISTPDYHDAFNRLYDPAAFYLDPLYQSGQDFKQLVHENGLLGIAFTVKAKARLLKFHGQIWQEHVDILTQVTSGKISGAGGRERINRLIDRYRQGLQGEQQQISREYIAMQNKRRAKFDPVAKKAIANAKTSIQRACNESSDGGLSNLLPPVRTAYIQALNTRSSEFPRTQGQYAGLAPVVSIWQQRLFPALTAWDQNNEKLLKNYLLGQGGYSDSSFEGLFDAYNRHQATDFSVFEVVRL